VKRTAYEVKPAASITIGPSGSRGSGSYRYTAIPIRLNGVAGAEELAEPKSREEARALAARIAIALDLSVRKII
jgi:hypothetical protein